jgi:UTP--glucose-1-phosphate uridylyltransferase
MPKITKAVIPVAGLGTRFLPATKAQPKEMLNLVDKPIIQYIVEEVVGAGITDIIFITSKNKRSLEDHFDRDADLERHLEAKGKKKEAQIIRDIAHLANFVFVRQKEPRGDGDAILAAKNIIGDEPFVVVFGDDIVTDGPNTVSKLIQTYDRYQDPVVAVDLVPKKDVSRYGIVSGKKMSERIYSVDGLVEKPAVDQAPSRLALIGKYVVTSEVVDALARVRVPAGGELRLIEGLATVARKRSIYAYQIEGRRFDCGSKLGFLEATVHFGLQHPEIKKQFVRYLRSR